MDKDLAIAGAIVVLSFGLFFMNIIPNWVGITGCIIAGGYLMISPNSQKKN